MFKKTVSFIVSGRGSNFQTVAEKIKSGYIKANLGIVISDKAEARALTIAGDFGMDSYFINPRDFPGREAHESEMIRLLEKYKTDLVVAAGYMRILTAFFIRKYRNRIINIHPALLPSFPGVHSQQQALDYGVKITGCTTHFIDEGTDTGPIIIQSPISVMDDDGIESLSSRILKEEHRILPESVKLFCEGRLRINGRKVYIDK